MLLFNHLSVYLLESTHNGVPVGSGPIALLDPPLACATVASLQGEAFTHNDRATARTTTRTAQSMVVVAKKSSSSVIHRPAPQEPQATLCRNQPFTTYIRINQDSVALQVVRSG